MIIGYTVSEIWCMTDVIVIFHFGLFFTLLPLTDRKIKNSRKWKKGLEISSFYTIVPKIMIKCYTVPEICHMADVTYFSFWTIFCCYPPNSLKNQNFKKMKKKAWRYHHFTHVSQKLWFDDVQFLTYGV